MNTREYKRGAGLDGVEEEDLNAYYSNSYIAVPTSAGIRMRYCEQVREGAVRVCRLLGFREPTDHQWIPIDDVDWTYRLRLGVIGVHATPAQAAALKDHGLPASQCDYIRLMPLQTRVKGFTLEKIPRSNRFFFESACVNFGRSFTDLLDELLEGKHALNGNRCAMIDKEDNSVLYRGLAVGSWDPDSNTISYKKPYTYLGGLLGHAIQ